MMSQVKMRIVIVNLNQIKAKAEIIIVIQILSQRAKMKVHNKKASVNSKIDKSLQIVQSLTKREINLAQDLTNLKLRIQLNHRKRIPLLMKRKIKKVLPNKTLDLKIKRIMKLHQAETVVMRKTSKLIFLKLTITILQEIITPPKIVLTDKALLGRKKTVPMLDLTRSNVS